MRVSKAKCCCSKGMAWTWRNEPCAICPMPGDGMTLQSPGHIYKCCNFVESYLYLTLFHSSWLCRSLSRWIWLRHRRTFARWIHFYLDIDWLIQNVKTFQTVSQLATIANSVKQSCSRTLVTVLS